MKRRRMIVCGLCIAAILCCMVFSSCGTETEPFSSHFFEYFDTVTTVTGYAADRAEFDRVCGEIRHVLAEYHRLFTIYEGYEGVENLHTLNLRGESQPISVDGRIIEMLLYAKEMYRKTDGHMNVAMGSVLSIWHDYREAGMNDPKNASLPPMERLLQASAHCNIDDVLIDTENGTVMLADPEMMLDVGAIAKGYAVEMAARMLEERGITGYVINVGGNVRTVGTKADGADWIVGIENPEDDGAHPYLAILQLSGESLVTSGSYQRYYTVGGKKYHHIIDPETLMPAEGYLSVSVVCRNSAEGDALSTALFCMSPDEGMALVQGLDGVEAMWVFSGGEIRYSDGFSSYLQSGKMPS